MDKKEMIKVIQERLLKNGLEYYVNDKFINKTNAYLLLTQKISGDNTQLYFRIFSELSPSVLFKMAIKFLEEIDILDFVEYLSMLEIILPLD